MKVRFAVAPGGAAQEGQQINAFADALEMSGFDGVWLSDVPLGRNPFLLAKELAQLDQLCSGRLLLSFVPGLDHPGEREVLGVSGAARGAVLEETLGLVRRWWAGEVVEYRGTRWSFPEVPAAARPLQDPLEVWLGGRGPKALERVGRIADGWLGAAVTPEEAHAACERIQQSAQSAMREFDPEHFGLSIPYTRTAPDPALLRGILAQRPDVDPLALMPVGAVALRELIVRHIDAGLSKFVVRPAGVVTSWEDEVDWLTGAILNLQT